MSERRQKIRGTTLELDQVVGAQGLLAYDYEKFRLRLYDGVNMGGHEILNADDIAAMYTLPVRLNPYGIEIEGAARSANEALLDGYYVLFPNITDLPTGVTTVSLVHVVAAEDNQVSQTLIESETGRGWFRSRKADNVWVAWKRVADLDYLTNDPNVSAYNAARLGGQLPAYYTAINDRLGYTAANKAGDNFTGPVTIASTLGATGVVKSDAGLAAGTATFSTTGDSNGTTWGGTLSAWLTANKVSKAGDSMSGSLTMATANIVMTRVGTGAAPSRTIHMDGDSIGFLTSAAAWAFRVDNAGNSLATGELGAGAARLSTAGAVSGSQWADWGSTDAKSAISARIEARAAAWANDRVSNFQYRLASFGTQASNPGYVVTVPNGAMVTYLQTTGADRFTLGWRYPQVYDPVRGWVGFSNA